jgi:DNA-binding NarL/FixJ family response regulator
VLVVDDDPLFRETISALLEREQGIHVAGFGANGEEAVQRALLLRPDVVTMDIDMPIMDGVEATKRIAELLPDVRVLLVSASLYAERAETARAAGASGYITKSHVAEGLVDAITAIARGENFVVGL